MFSALSYTIDTLYSYTDKIHARIRVNVWYRIYSTHTTAVLVNAQRISKGMAWGLNGSRETLQNRHSDIRVNFQLVCIDSLRDVF